MPTRRRSFGVVFLLSLLISFLFEWPWNLVAVLVGAVLEIGEITWGLRLARRRAQTGAGTMVGRTAEVTQACRPDGLVRLDGEFWQAHCDAGADAGDTVRITAVRGLTLDVEPLAQPSSA
jgi:membrane-bound serine protease (ClpP class)